MCASEVERLRGGWGRDLRRRPPLASGVGSETVRALELKHYLPNQLLRDTDAMSMSQSLEVRVPLLDDDVVAAAAGYVRPGDLEGKQLLAVSVDPELLPIATSPKRTFTLPVDAWLRGSLHDWAGDMLHSLAGASMGFDRRQLFAFFHDFQYGRAGWRALWSLCVLGAWLNQNQSGR
jgi:asparagine synthase (glutamine-hydrolysing)